MKSVRRVFEKIQTRHPDWSTLVIFSETISNRRYSDKIINRWFTKLVEADDYDQSNRQGVLRDLRLRSNPLEDNQIRLENGLHGDGYQQPRENPNRQPDIPHKPFVAFSNGKRES